LVQIGPQEILGFETAGPRLLPLRGLPLTECGMFTYIPQGLGQAESAWETPEVGRPAQIWKIAGRENVGSVRCVKLVGLQQTEDWHKARADHAAWRRMDSVWINPRLGVGQKVERTIEHREPGRGEPTRKSFLTYELASDLKYPGELAQDRRREIAAASRFA